METWNHIDLFSGANAFRMGFEAAGFTIGKHFYSEIDAHAIANTRYNYPESEYIGSVTDVSGLRPEGRTFITFGWPCQDNSIAGKRKGHAAGTRSGLLFEAVRLIDEVRPEFFVAENVEGLRTVNKGIDIVEAVKFLAFLNESLPQYDVEMQLLNTRWFLPQNRERLYFVGHLRNGSSKQVFPIGENDIRASKGTANPAVIRCFTAGGNSGGMHSGMTLLKINSATPLIRRLTPVECERLQGWPDNHTHYGIYGEVVKQISDTQRYRLCGNGVSVPCVQAVATKLHALYH